jgi:hypothetical protein
MKYFYIAIICLLFSGCVKKHEIEFTGTAPGIKNGVFVIKTEGDSTLYGENIKDGKFAVPKQLFKAPGYYLMEISDTENKENKNSFEVYLEGGTYTVQAGEAGSYTYPKITSPSKIQEQLSAFYTISDKLSVDAEKEDKKLKTEIKKDGERMSREAYVDLINRLGAVDARMLANNVIALKEYLKQYPNSVIGAHLMSKMNYENDPVGFYAVYQTLPVAVKTSEDGVEIGDKLNRLIKLEVGAKAPAINGNTPDGKPFDSKTFGKKIILIDFWRAVNEISRKNHQQMMEMLAQPQNKGRFDIVSISLDRKTDWWTNAIKEDKLTWTQVCDLKGDDSPNAANWNVTRVPTYYLVDGNWNIVARDIDFNNIPLEVDSYLKKHR